MSKRRGLLSRILEIVVTTIILGVLLALFVGGFFNHELWGWLFVIVIGGSALGCLWIMTSSEYNPW